MSPSTDCPNREAEEAAIGIEAENNTEVLLKGLFSYISSQRTAKENVDISLSDTGSLVTIVTEKAEEPNPPPPAPISLLKFCPPASQYPAPGAESVGTQHDPLSGKIKLTNT